MIDPVLVLRTLDDSREIAVASLANNPQCLVATSRQAIRILAEWELACAVPLVVAGHASERLATELGFRHAMSAGGNAASIPAHIREYFSPAQGDVIYFSGEDISRPLHKELVDHGFAAQRIAVYEALPAPHLKDTTCEALDNGAIKAVTFFSQRTAGHFYALLKQHHIEHCMPNLSAVCLSAEIATSISRHNWKNLLYTDATPIEWMVQTVRKCLSE